MTAVMSLQNLTDDEFENVVNRDVRGELDYETSLQLRTPENAERWYEQLLVLKRSVEAQFTANRAERNEKQQECMAKGPKGKTEWFAYRAQAERWRAGAARFKAGVEQRLAEARLLVDTKKANRYVDIVERERNEAIEEIVRLRRLIQTHHDHECGDECDDDSCAGDTMLWAILDEEPRF